MKINRRVVALVAAVLGLVGLAATPALAEPVGGSNAVVSPLSAVPQALPQTDNTAFALAYANGVLYVGGDFTTVRPAGAAPGTQTVSQPRLAAIDTATNTLIASWAPAVTGGDVFALSVSPDGKRLYAGGTFTKVNNVSHLRLAGFDISNPRSPALLTGSQFGASTNGKVDAVDATDTAVYAGGYFTTAGGASRTSRVASFGAAGGKVLPFNPSLSGVSAPSYTNPFVTAVKADSSGRVIVGGLFDNVNGSPQHGLAVVDGTTGVSDPAFKIPTILNTSYVTAVALDSGRMYIAGRDDKTGDPNRLEGVMALNAATGASLWGSDGHRCLGDSFALQPLDGQVWVGTHAHDCSRVGGYPEKSPRFYGATLGQDLGTGEQDHFYPETFGNSTPGSMNNVRAFATDGTRLFVAGGFLKMSGVSQQDLTAFGPKNGGGGTTPLVVGRPTAISSSTGAVTVSWTTSDDRDNRNLTYKVYRNSGTTPIGQVTAASPFWAKTTQSFRDSSAPVGSTVTYKVSATDGSNSSAKSLPSTAITVAGPATTYSQAVLDDAPATYWKLNDSPGTSAADSSSHGDTGTVTSGTFGVAGVQATGLSMSGNNHLYSSTARVNPTSYSEESWIKTNTGAGGKIMGMGNAGSGTSSQYDRHVYMTNAGRIVFGVYDGGTTTVSSPNSYNDGQWHHVVATQGGSGMTLYVDGAAVASNTVTGAENTTLYFRVGADSLNGWPDQPTNDGMSGTYDEVAYYAGVLTADQVAQHYTLGQ